MVAGPGAPGALAFSGSGAGERVPVSCGRRGCFLRVSFFYGVLTASCAVVAARLSPQARCAFAAGAFSSPPWDPGFVFLGTSGRAFHTLRRCCECLPGRQRRFALGGLFSGACVAPALSAHSWRCARRPALAKRCSSLLPGSAPAPERGSPGVSLFALCLVFLSMGGLSRRERRAQSSQSGCALPPRRTYPIILCNKPWGRHGAPRFAPQNAQTPRQGAFAVMNERVFRQPRSRFFRKKEKGGEEVPAGLRSAMGGP